MKMICSGLQRACVCLMLTAILAGCGGVTRPTTAASSNSSGSTSVSSLDSAEQYYRFGLQQLAENELSAAAKTLDEMEIQYPLNIETGEMYAALLSAYKKAGETDKVIKLADRLILMFPGHRYVAYSHYLAALVDYERGRYMVSRDVIKSDPTYAKTALARFKTLLKCCGSNKYAFTAKQYVYHLESMISLYEFYYMESDYNAGRIDITAQRGISLLVTYPDSVAAQQAQTILVSKEFDEYRLYIGEAIRLSQYVAVEEKVEEPEPEAAKFAVHLESSSSSIDLKSKIKAMGLAGEVDYYKKIEEGKTYFIAVYGGFASNEDAKQTRLELRVRTGVPGLWVRSLEDTEFVENIDDEAPDFYGIQIMSSSKLDSLKRAVESIDVTNGLGYYKSVVDGSTSFNAVYGNFAVRDDATEALLRLRSRTNIAGLWVRSLKNIELVESVADALPIARLPISVPVSAAIAPIAVASYAVQMMSSSNLGSLKQAVEATGITDGAGYYKNVIDGKTHFIAVYGKFAVRDDATEALLGLRSRTNIAGLWVRSLKNIELVEVEDVADVLPMAVASVGVEAAGAVSEPVAADVSYTIQVLSYDKLEPLRKAVAAMDMVDDVSLFSHEVKGKTYYIAVYGRYSGWSVGKTDLAKLEKRTGKKSYWLREFDFSKAKAFD